MKRLTAALFATAVLAAPQAFAENQVAGHTELGVSVTELDAVIKCVKRRGGMAGQVRLDNRNQGAGGAQKLADRPAVVAKR